MYEADIKGGRASIAPEKVPQSDVAAGALQHPVLASELAVGRALLRGRYADSSLGRRKSFVRNDGSDRDDGSGDIRGHQRSNVQERSRYEALSQRQDWQWSALHGAHIE
ncbi:hypothetical protein D3C72_2283890 [compost metagenome]